MIVRETRAVVVSLILLSVSVLLQTTVLDRIAIRGAKPDLTLIILTFISLRRGSMMGQLEGFAVGMAEDFVSLTPLGFHALIRSTLGFVFGLMVGNVFVDSLLMPVVFVVAATLMRGLLAAFLSSVFSVSREAFSSFSGPLWIELVYNAVLSPFLFALLGLLKDLKPVEKRRA